MPLSDPAIRAAKGGEKPCKLFDTKGLFLLVTPQGSKLWRVKYRFAHKDQLLSLGAYPEVTLKQARVGRDEVRRQVTAGIDPSAARKALKATQAGEGSFEVLAREWIHQFAPGWVPTHTNRVLRRLEVDLFPWIGARPVGEITAPELLQALRRIQARCV